MAAGGCASAAALQPSLLRSSAPPIRLGGVPSARVAVPVHGVERAGAYGRAITRPAPSRVANVGSPTPDTAVHVLAALVSTFSLGGSPGSVRAAGTGPELFRIAATPVCRTVIKRVCMTGPTQATAAPPASASARPAVSPMAGEPQADGALCLAADASDLLAPKVSG